MTRAEVEEATTGDLAGARVQHAVGKLWAVFLTHAKETGDDTAAALNGSEAPPAARPTVHLDSCDAAAEALVEVARSKAHRSHGDPSRMRRRRGSGCTKSLGPRG